MTRWLLVAVVFCLLCVIPARADVEVSYVVDATAFKAAISGTALTFTLYSDSACTVSVATQMINAENVTVIESLKRITPKGATKPPKTARLTATITGATSPAAGFLKVTGTGITAVGGNCQLQLSSTNNPAGYLTGEGFVKAWARINSDGTVASCYKCGTVVHIGTGTYTVSFSPFSSDITTRPRSATLDTLSSGTTKGSIGVANDFGDMSGVFVLTTDNAGTSTDKAFSLLIY